MIVFELTIPGFKSFSNQRFVKARDERRVPTELWGKSFHFKRSDGWEADVLLTRMSAKDARKLERKSAGFSRCDWMINSIIRNGKIIEPYMIIDDGYLGDR